jgi:UDP-N-acetylmuramyl pentapeptide phosphotransferase/UDP-N-acetylglucosamine-1-phosphate transferase
MRHVIRAKPHVSPTEALVTWEKPHVILSGARAQPRIRLAARATVRVGGARLVRFEMMLIPLVVALGVALVGGRAYVRWAPRRALDIPNQRSSHTRPTPRGGGLVIVSGFFVGLAVWLSMGGGLSPRALGWLAGALLVASISFVDDLRPLPAVPRLLTHVLAAVVLTIVGVQQRETPVLLALPLAFVWIGLVTNVYNFMDGIDGLAATQAVIAGAALAIGGSMVKNPLLATSGSLLAAASIGFLVYNLPPARLFMGDVGSTFLGFSFAGLSLLGNIGVGGGRLPVEFGAVILAPFLFDSLVTLARRMARGERWYAAHRSHYYQRLTQRGLSHRQVTGLYAGLAVAAACAGLVGLVVDAPVRQLLAALAYVPMLAVVALVWRLEASDRQPEQPNEAPTVVTQGHS